jgi:hypothetical protein
MTSFAFPRNRIAHVDLLPQHGFTAFRGQDTSWYARATERRWFHRAGHLVDIIRAATPEPGLPIWREEGIWEIPGSMLFTPSHGLRRIIPAKARVRRARRGMLAAAESRKIFHLWFHPTDLVIRKEAMLDGLRQILEYACELRDTRRLIILPMSGIVDLMTQNQQQTQHSLEEALSR